MATITYSAAAPIKAAPLIAINVHPRYHTVFKTGLTGSNPIKITHSPS